MKEENTPANDLPPQRFSKIVKYARYVSIVIVFSGAAFFAYAGYALRDDIAVTSQVSYVFAAVMAAIFLFMLYPWERAVQTRPALFKVFLALSILSIFSALQLLLLAAYYALL